MRRVNAVAILGAMALLAGAPSGRGLIEDTALREEARHMVAQHGARFSGNVSPVELMRRGEKRRRARQTHPGKRGGR